MGDISNGGGGGSSDLQFDDSVTSAKQIYERERVKRLRKDGSSQFIDLHAHPKFKSFQADPWAQIEVPGDSPTPPKDGDKSEILIMGAGFAGLLFAVRLLQAGFRLEDIRIVDSAGGFGGTWCKPAYTSRCR